MTQLLDARSRNGTDNSTGNARLTLDALTQQQPLDPVRDAQAIFRVLLDALSRPGRIEQLPALARGAPGNPWAVAALLTLLDHETGLYVASATTAAPTASASPATGTAPATGSAPATSATTTPDGAESASGVARYLRQRTMARDASAAEADFVLVETADVDPALPVQLKRGTLAYPDGGATLIALVDELTGSVPAGVTAGELSGSEAAGTAADERTELLLTGPGIPPETGGMHVSASRLPASLVEARNEAVDEYPLGIDLFLIDVSGRVVGIPRSTAVSLADVTATAVTAATPPPTDEATTTTPPAATAAAATATTKER